MREVLVINSSRQVELYDTIKQLQYVPYVILQKLYPNKKNFKRDIYMLKKAELISLTKIGKKVYVYPFENSPFFKEKHHELFCYFWYKVIKSGGKVFFENNKIVTAKEHVFIFELLPEINAIRLKGDKNNYLTTLEKLQNFQMPLHECLNPI